MYVCNPAHRVSRPRGAGSVGDSVGEGLMYDKNFDVLSENFDVLMADKNFDVLSENSYVT